MNQKRTVLFIGNGFDLAFDSKTSYKNFVESEQFKELIIDENQLAIFIYKKFETNDKKWVDIEIEIGNYSKKISKEANGTELSTTSLFKKNYEQLSSALQAYLYTQKGGKENVKLLNEVKKWVSESEQDQTVVICFNYTPHVHVFFFNEYRISVRYIHGSLLKQDESNIDIVVGVDENCNIVPEHSFIYKSFNSKTEIRGIIDTILNAEKLIFFGCSIGETDEFYFSELFKSAKNKIFQIYYYGTFEEEYIRNRVHLLSGSMAKFKSENDITFTDSKQFDIKS